MTRVNNNLYLTCAKFDLIVQQSTLNTDTIQVGKADDPLHASFNYAGKTEQVIAEY